MKNKPSEVLSPISQLIRIIKEIAYEQGTRDNSGISWAQDIIDRLTEVETKLSKENQK